MIKPRQAYYGMVALNSILVLSIIGVVFIGEQVLKSHSDELVNHKLENALLEQEQVSLVEARKDIEEYSELRDIAKQVVPQEKDQAATIRTILALADKAGVGIGSITFPASTLGEAKAKSPVSQAEAVPGINGLLSLDITIVSDSKNPSEYASLVEFLENLENNRRTAQVSTISITPDGTDPNKISFSLTLKVYIKP
jgi:hypothetical protein